MRIAIRGFIGGVKQFEEVMEESAFCAATCRLADEHVLKLSGQPGGEKHMIEIEFLDEPDPLQRFFRLGTDPAMMVQPIEVSLHAD